MGTSLDTCQHSRTSCSWFLSDWRKAECCLPLLSPLEWYCLYILLPKPFPCFSAIAIPLESCTGSSEHCKPKQPVPAADFSVSLHCPPGSHHLPPQLPKQMQNRFPPRTLGTVLVQLVFLFPCLFRYATESMRKAQEKSSFVSQQSHKEKVTDAFYKT